MQISSHKPLLIINVLALMSVPGGDKLMPLHTGKITISLITSKLENSRVQGDLLEGRRSGRNQSLK